MVNREVEIKLEWITLEVVPLVLDERNDLWLADKTMTVICTFNMLSIRYYLCQCEIRHYLVNPFHPNFKVKLPLKWLRKNPRRDFL